MRFPMNRALTGAAFIFHPDTYPSLLFACHSGTARAAFAFSLVERTTRR